MGSYERRLICVPFTVKPTEIDTTVKKNILRNLFHFDKALNRANKDLDSDSPRSLVAVQLSLDATALVRIRLSV